MIPPAVDAGAAPINISTVIITFVKGIILLRSKQGKPAVLELTLTKTEVSIFSPSGILPIVAGLLNSEINTSEPPKTIRNAVIRSTTFVCRSSLFVVLK